MRVRVTGTLALTLSRAGRASGQAQVPPLPPQTPPKVAPGPPPPLPPAPGFVSTYEIVRTLRSAGFDPLAPPLREGTIYVARATDYRGILMRVVLDARTGAIRDANRIVPGPGNYGGPYGGVYGEQAYGPYGPGPYGPDPDDEDDAGPYGPGPLWPARHCPAALRTAAGRRWRRRRRPCRIRHSPASRRCRGRVRRSLLRAKPPTTPNRRRLRPTPSLARDRSQTGCQGGRNNGRSCRAAFARRASSAAADCAG